MAQTGKWSVRVSRAACVSILVLLPFAAFAATSEAPSLVPQAPVSASSATLPSCFTYYRFGSVTTTLSSDLATFDAGAPVAVDAYVENQNAYPIVDATVYVRVLKVGSLDKNVNGDDVVDDFPIVEHLTLKAGEQKHITFLWHVPSDADPGAYRMTSFVVQDDRFNFLGLTFTDDVTGPSFNFNVANDSTGGVRFDRTSAVLGGAPYHFAAYAPAVPAGGNPVSMDIAAVNTSDHPYIGNLVWSLYSWDGVNPANELDTVTKPFALGAHASTTVSYTVTDATHAVYYVTGTLATTAGSKSIVGLRFARPDVATPRLSAVEAMQYPLAPGALAFACFQSGSTNYATGVHATLSVETLPLFGLFSIPLASTHFDGTAPGELVALTVPVKQALSSFQVVATVSQNGKLIDRVAIPYRCEDLGTCPEWLWPAAAILGLVLALLFIALLVSHRRKRRVRYTAAEHRSMVSPPSP